MPDSRLRPRVTVAAALCSLLFLAGCSGAAKGNSSTAHADGAGPTVIGTDGSAESRVVAALYGELLADAGVKVRMASTRYSSPADTTRAVAEGRIGLAPAYETSTLRALPAGQTLPGNMAATLSMALPPGIDALPPAKAENGVVLAVPRSTASKHHLRTLADLTKASSLRTLGGSASRDADAPSPTTLQQAYGVHLTAIGTSATADVLVLRATDPVLTHDGLVVLTDSKGVLSPEHVFPLIGAPYAGRTACTALARINSRLTTVQLADLAASVEDGEQPSEAARNWLRSNGLVG